jgi:hypothetical protein
MVKVIQADMISERGLSVIDGEAELLTGFEFNISKLGTACCPYTTKHRQNFRAITVSIDSFVPANMIAAPGGTTHFKITRALK